MNILKNWKQQSSKAYLLLSCVWLIAALFLCTSCNSSFLRSAKQIGSEALCSAATTSAVTLAQDIAIHDVPHLPFWKDGRPIPLQEQRNFCVERIRAERYLILEKPWKGKDHFSTTVPLPLLDKIPGWQKIPGSDRIPSDIVGVVLTRNGLDHEPLINQVVSYCHELVHVYTEKRLGLLTSGVAYAIPSTRAGFELAPYGVSMAVHYLNGMSLGRRNAKALKIVDSLHTNYLIRAIPKDCLRSLALGFWQNADWLRPEVVRSNFAIGGKRNP